MMSPGEFIEWLNSIDARFVVHNTKYGPKVTIYERKAYDLRKANREKYGNFEVDKIKLHWNYKEYNDRILVRNDWITGCCYEEYVKKMVMELTN